MFSIHIWLKVGRIHRYEPVDMEGQLYMNLFNEPIFDFVDIVYWNLFYIVDFVLLCFFFYFGLHFFFQLLKVGA